MGFVIIVQTQSGVPVYRQIIEQIRFQIAGGSLAPGDELPSTRALSAHLGVNPMTVSKAYASLEQDGVLVRRPGKPLIVADVEADESRRDQARRLLAPAATGVRQLGLDDETALEVFRDLLQDTRDEEETS